jgi:hypothetical protein
MSCTQSSQSCSFLLHLTLQCALVLPTPPTHRLTASIAGTAVARPGVWVLHFQLGRKTQVGESCLQAGGL